MTKKYENISVGVYWDDASVPDWKLPGWLNETDVEGDDLWLLCLLLHALHTQLKQMGNNQL
jgi:hypothetical protein